MAILRPNDIRKAETKELLGKLEELKKELIKLNSQKSTGSVPENPGKIKEIKKTLARIYTLLNERGGGNKSE